MAHDQKTLFDATGSDSFIGDSTSGKYVEDMVWNR